MIDEARLKCIVQLWRVPKCIDISWIDMEGQDILLYLATFLRFLAALVVLHSPTRRSGAFSGHCRGVPPETLLRLYASSLG